MKSAVSSKFILDIYSNIIISLTFGQYYFDRSGIYIPSNTGPTAVLVDSTVSPPNNDLRSQYLPNRPHYKHNYKNYKPYNPSQIKAQYHNGHRQKIRQRGSN